MTDEHLIASLSGLQVVALTLWAEARGESLAGQVAVGAVIRNRFRAAWMGAKSYRDVCLSHAQFSCWSPVGGEANYLALLTLARTVLEGGTPLPPDYHRAEWIAEGIVSEAAPDETRGATNYLTTSLYMTNPPAWAAGLRVTVSIGRHTFGR